MRRRSVRGKRWWLGASFTLLVAATSLVAWRMRASIDRAGVSPPMLAEKAGREENAIEVELSSDDVDDAASRHALVAPGAAAVESGPDRSLDGVAPPPPAELSVVALQGRLVDPRHEPVRPAGARVELVDETGVLRAVDVHDPEDVLITGLAAGRYRIRVHADGFRHREQQLDCTGQPDGSHGSSDGDQPLYARLLILWPERWVPVVVRTSNGEPLDAIAAELGVEPKRLVVSAFDARASREPPGADAWTRDQESPSARFHLPPGWQSWQLPGSCIGSLELVEDPPLWIGLSVLGTPLGWELLAPGQDEVVFQLDPQEFLERTSQLTLRVVDRTGRAPLTDSIVTLKADTSAHRREEHLNARPDSHGFVRLENVVPGRYDLSVVTPGAMHQERIEIGPAERIDKGEIALAASAGILVRAEGFDPTTTEVCIEVAPHVRGASVEEHYPPNLWRWVDEKGELVLPMPSARSIVRATAVSLAEHYETGARSTDVVVDPNSPPAGPLVLLVRSPSEAIFDAVPSGTAKVEVLDEIGLVVESIALAEARSTRAELIPGRYRARAIDASGTSLQETSFVVGDEPVHVLLP